MGGFACLAVVIVTPAQVAPFVAGRRGSSSPSARFRLASGTISGGTIRSFRIAAPRGNLLRVQVFLDGRMLRRVRLTSCYPVVVRHKGGIGFRKPALPAMAAWEAFRAKLALI